MNFGLIKSYQQSKWIEAVQYSVGLGWKHLSKINQGNLPPAPTALDPHFTERDLAELGVTDLTPLIFKLLPSIDEGKKPITQAILNREQPLYFLANFHAVLKFPR
jgi:hypothetical protein